MKNFLKYLRAELNDALMIIGVSATVGFGLSAGVFAFFSLVGKFSK